MPTIIEAVSSPNIWGPWIKNPATFAAWFSFLKAVLALPMDEAERATFRECTGCSAPRPDGYLDPTLVIGRRGGKSLMLAPLGIMRQLGVRGLVVACLNPQCRHEAIIGADDYAEEAMIDFQPFFAMLDTDEAAG